MLKRLLAFAALVLPIAGQAAMNCTYDAGDPTFFKGDKVVAVDFKGSTLVIRSTVSPEHDWTYRVTHKSEMGVRAQRYGPKGTASAVFDVLLGGEVIVSENTMIVSSLNGASGQGAVARYKCY